MKIVIADGLPASAIEILQQPDWKIDNRQGRPAAELTADLKDADALVVRSATKVTREMIEAAPRLRVIARAGTGVDNVDVPAATARGIVVMNAPGANSLSVAELAMGLILSLARNIPAADASMKTSKWEKSKFAGAEIRSKTLGLVGLGRIGQEVAARAHAFEMKVIAHDPVHLGRNGGDAWRGARLARRSVRARRLHLAARARAALDQAPLQCRALREVQEGRCASSIPRAAS